MEPGESDSELHVAAGVLADEHGHVLIAQRPPSAALAGAWEFPGGKIAIAEIPLQGLVRELHEELGIQVRYARYLLRYSHTEHGRRIWLYVWRVLHWQGQPRGAEGQNLRWLPVDKLMAEGLLRADEPIVNFLLRDAAVHRRKNFSTAAIER